MAIDTCLHTHHSILAIHAWHSAQKPQLARGSDGSRIPLSFMWCAASVMCTRQAMHEMDLACSAIDSRVAVHRSTLCVWQWTIAYYSQYFDQFASQ